MKLVEKQEAWKEKGCYWGKKCNNEKKKLVLSAIDEKEWEI